MASVSAYGADGEWTVRKASGEVWAGAAGLQLVSLGQSQAQETVLKPGDTVTTGRNGRVLLVRGQETILIAPNSVVGIPAEKKDSLATTITQQAGSILLEVEKRNVPHFEVETPYLAAVVKGTQFRVSVTATGTRVDVQRGKVEVVDFKTGQIAQVLPGQAAQSFARSAQGLSLTGAGTFEPILRGAPRTPTLEQIKVPKSGIRTPPALERGVHHQNMRSAHGTHQQDARSARGAHHGAVRISAPLGEVRLNVHKATHGLARSTNTAGDAGRRASGQATTIWNAGDGQSGTATTAGNDSNANGASGAGAASAGSVSAGSAATAAVAAVAAGSNSNGNGNGNGNGKGNNGNGNGNGGGNGNGNGNAGNGNGNGNGHGKGKS
jgi:hypothetical protein